MSSSEESAALYIVFLIVLYISCIGALNWGLIGTANFNLVAFLFPSILLQQIIYIIIGLAALLTIAISITIIVYHYQQKIPSTVNYASHPNIGSS